MFLFGLSTFFSFFSFFLADSLIFLDFFFLFSFLGSLDFSFLFSFLGFLDFFFLFSFLGFALFTFFGFFVEKISALGYAVSISKKSKESALDGANVLGSDGIAVVEGT